MSQTFVVDVDCCGGEKDPTAAPPFKVFQPPPLKQYGRRAALRASLLGSAGAVLAACGPAATPTAPAATTAPPKPTETAKPGEAAKPATKAGETPKPAAKPDVVLTVSASGKAGLEKVQLAFCSQVLCILPYEVARRRGFWESEGLDLELIYM